MSSAVLPTIVKTLKHAANTQICQRVVAPVMTTQVRTEYSWPGYGSRYGFTSWQMKKDFKKREIVRDQHVTRMRLNAIRKNKILPKELQEIADVEIAAEPRNSNPIRLVKRCAITGRAKGTVKPWRVSRIMWRHYADYNQLSGYTRSCW